MHTQCLQQNARTCSCRFLGRSIPIHLESYKICRIIITYMYHQQLKELDRPYLHDMAYNAFILTWSDGSLSRRVISFGRMFISIAAF